MSKKIFKIINENKLVFLLLLSAIIFRLCIPYISFASTDLSNLMNKYLYLKNEIDINDIPNITLPIPRFPFVINLFNISGVIADYLNLNIVFFIKYLAVVFELALAALILKIYLLKTNLKNNNKFYIFFLILIITNPLSIYVNSFLGFFETLWIFFLLLVVYIFEFEKQDIKSFYIPILLAISISIKPVGIIFLLYFFYRSKDKTSFILLFLISFLFLNSYFIIGVINNPWKIYNLFDTIISALLVGTQTGEFGMSEIEKLYLMLNIGYNSIIFTLVKLFELILYAYIYIKLINSNKIKSYEFIFIIFYLTIIFNDNLHANYLYWIIPFGYILNYKRITIFSFIVALLVLESETRSDTQALIFNYLSNFNFFEEGNQFEDRIYSASHYFLKIFLFYGSLLILFEKKLLKVIFFSKLRISKQIKEIFFKLIDFNKFKLTFNRKLIFSKYNLMLWPFVILILYNHGFLTSIVSKSQYEFKNLDEPISITKFHSHGNNVEYKSYIQVDSLQKKYEIIVMTGYYSTIFINDQKFISGRNILHFIEDRYKHEKKLKNYPLRKFNINKFIKLGKNEIKILSNNPHSIKKFGLIFYLMENNEISKQNTQLNWNAKINKKHSELKIVNLNENIYYKKFKIIFEKYENVDGDIKILKLADSLNDKLINPYAFLAYLVSIVGFLNLLCCIRVRKLRSIIS
jgi:hypothetical protein